jgi:hypothetical protein
MLVVHLKTQNSNCYELDGDIPVTDLLKTQKSRRSVCCYSGGILERPGHRVSSLRYFMTFRVTPGY